MAAPPVYLVTGIGNDRTCFLVSDERDLAIPESQWGKPLADSWVAPRLEPFVRKPVSFDFAPFYLPGLLLASKAATAAVAYPSLELLSVETPGFDLVLLNPQRTLTRLVERGADLTRAGEAILLLRRADFYAEDIPQEPELFWFHDGNAPRFLLCNQSFLSRFQAAELSGLEFKLLGHGREGG